MANPENKIEKDIQSEIPKENKMGVMPVGQLLFTMSLPIMISMLVQALYNVVDSMFVARVSENALTALSIAFPIQNLMIAVSVGLGVGLNAVVSRCAGRKGYEGRQPRSDERHHADVYLRTALHARRRDIGSSVF